jgi:cell division inhibitor SepF
MSIWKRAMDYLGLGPDDAYDDYDDVTDDRPRPRHVEFDDTGARPAPTGRPTFPMGGDTPPRRFPTDDSGISPRPINPQPRPVAPVRAGGASAAPQVFRPRSFEAVQDLANRFREGHSVVLSLESADREVARRLLDFCYGVCYALAGTMEKRATGVYLLKPAASRSVERISESDEFDH